ncbi:MAG: TonB-dependent receptor, partial [Bacteroidaceae bacterium]
MKKEFLTALLLTASATQAIAQVNTSETEKDLRQDNAAFVFTESQLGEDEDMTQNVIMMNSNSNVYTSNVGYLWSPARFKFRAYNSRYSGVYMNGVNVNNGETGQFNYSTVGGMNDATRNIDTSSPFEANNFSMAGLGGSNNYNFRASNYAAGNKITLSGANRNYTTRAMYTYASGLSQKGWAFMGTVGYRWANMNTSNVEGNFYNSLSYFLSLQKVLNEKHSLNLATWGNPTERAQQGASTDEAYWLANNYQYNPYWGYQDGKKRNSRVVNNYEPSVLLTWDFQIKDNMKLTTSAFFKYAMYSSTKLNYNGQNPAPDYWKNFPSNNANVWNPSENEDWTAWQESYDYWTASKRNRQINWDRLYYANRQLNSTGNDAIYWVEAKHNDHLVTNLGSTYDWDINRTTKFRAGLQLASNKGMHYTTMEDMLGAQYFHNVNTYAIGDYASADPRVQYDLNNPNGAVREGDRMRYDYDLWNQSARLWMGLTKDKGISHSYLNAQIGGTQMWRNGYMRNGMCADYSYGKSGKAYFLDGGFKIGTTLNLGKGNALNLGAGYEARAPQASVAFESPEMNNNYVDGLTNEKIASAELGYSFNGSWLRANLTGYFTHSYDGTEWQNFYNDDTNSFTYNSFNGVEKNYYGAELGLNFKVTSSFDINVIGTWAEAKYMSNTDVVYMISTSADRKSDVCYNKGMRES